MNIPNHIAQVQRSEVEAVFAQMQQEPCPRNAPARATWCSGNKQLEGVDPRVLCFRVTSNLTSLNRSFLELKRAHGTCYAFHGSAVENWYSLLKHGARNMSQKAGYMIHGAAHGPGIYLGHNYSTSLGYCQGRQPSVVAICEVVKKPELATTWNKGWCIVVPEAECVSIKYLVVKGLYD